MAEYHYDVVVIGSGPAGEGAALSAAKGHKRVAVIEDKGIVGGNCTHVGTIPSKALRHAVKQIITFNTNAMFRDIGEPRWFSFPSVLKNAEKVINKQVKLRTQFYARNKIDLYKGNAYFLDAKRVEIRGGNSTDVLHGDNVIIAPNVVIRAANHGLKREMPMRFQPHTYGEIIIGDDVWIGSNAVITSGVILAKGTVVGAGAVVTKSTKSYSIVGGVPARKIGERV